MNGNTMKLLVEYIADQNRRERERYANTYDTIYEKSVTDTNGVEQDWNNDQED